jgi:hypothetical protein
MGILLCKRRNKNKWPEAEAYIKTNPEFWNLYTKYVTDVLEYVTEVSEDQ